MSSTSSPEVVAGVLRIPIEDLVHGKNARGSDLGDVTELANSIRVFGMQQPILVEPGPDGRWSVWDGNRRLKACRQAGVTRLLAIPRMTPFTDQQRVLRQLGMHANGRSFDPMAEARAVEWLMFADDGPHMSREEIARALAKSPGWVKGRIDLLQLDPDEQASVANGTLPVSVALSTVAVRRGNGGRPLGPAARVKLSCTDGGHCGCVCHKRNQAP